MRVRVGVRRWAGDHEAEPGEEATGIIHVMWVDVNGATLRADDSGVLGITFQVSEKFARVTLELTCGDFETVDWRTA